MIVNEVKELIGKKLTFCDAELFECDDGSAYKFYHEQDCCESVGVYDIIGDLADLLGSPLLVAEEVSNTDELTPKAETEWGYEPESYTWTFYRFATVRGTVTVRWLGTSNGYYSESVDFKQLRPALDPQRNRVVGLVS